MTTWYRNQRLFYGQISEVIFGPHSKAKPYSNRLFWVVFYLLITPERDICDSSCFVPCAIYCAAVVVIIKPLCLASFFFSVMEVLREVVNPHQPEQGRDSGALELRLAVVFCAVLSPPLFVAVPCSLQQQPRGRDLDRPAARSTPAGASSPLEICWRRCSGEAGLGAKAGARGESVIAGGDGNG